MKKKSCVICLIISTLVFVLSIIIIIGWSWSISYVAEASKIHVIVPGESVAFRSYLSIFLFIEIVSCIIATLSISKLIRLAKVK